MLLVFRTERKLNASQTRSMAYRTGHTITRMESVVNSGIVVFSPSLEALELAEVKLKDLHIGNTSNSIPAEPIKMGLPLSSLRDIDFFGNRTFPAVCKNTFADLTVLDSQFDVHGRTLGHDYYDGDMDNLFGDPSFHGAIEKFIAWLQTFACTQTIA